jgi:SNF2 family DNA or RNA helicase
MKVDPNHHFGRKYLMTDAAKQEFYRRISPSVLRMGAEDHLDMPPRVDRTVEIDLPPRIATIYRDIEKKLFAQLDDGSDLVASSAGAKYTLCRQIANGGAYQTDPITEERSELYVHDAKLDAVREIVSELNGKPAIIAYQFDHDRDRLSKAYPKAPAIRGGLPIKRTIEIVDAWNAGEIPVLLVQPQALSHGANMQTGGRDLIWFGHTDQLEIYLQLNARIYRQGQTGQVRFHHVVARGTVDEAVFTRLMDKTADQDAMMKALQAYREGKGL